MRITIVAPLFGPITPIGSYGNHTIIADLARGLAARGHEVTLHAAEGSCVPGVEVVAVHTEPALTEAFTVPGTADGDSAGFVAARSGAMRRAFDQAFADVAARRPEAISQHAFNVEAFDLAEPWPTLHTLHMPPIAGAVVAACRATSHPIAAVSMAGQRAWEAATRRRVTLLRNGVPDLLGCGSADGPRPGPSVASLASSGAPVAVIAGRVSREKGTAPAIRLARRAGLEPCVVGSVSDEAYFQAEVAPLLDGQRPMPVPREMLGRMMASAAATLMPVCWEEPFGLVAAEAQICGCPVVAYRRGALPEVVGDGGGFLVEPGDEAGFLAAIELTIRLDRAVIRDRALARFGLDRMLTAYERELERIAFRGQRREMSAATIGHSTPLAAVNAGFPISRNH